MPPVAKLRVTLDRTCLERLISNSGLHSNERMILLTHLYARPRHWYSGLSIH